MRNTSGAKRVLGTRPGWSNHTTILLLVVSALGCGRKDQFIEGRVKDSCDRNWPICSQIAGCLLGTPSYIEGRLPGSTQFIVQLAEPSTVRLHVFVGENDQLGEFMREADLFGLGDHLVNFTSDTDCRYTLKVDVEAKRL